VGVFLERNGGIEHEPAAAGADEDRRGGVIATEGSGAIPITRSSVGAKFALLRFA